MQDILNHIESVRRDNNVLWMEVLRIALRCAPVETRSVLKKIRHNDGDIAALLGEIADGEYD